MCIIWQKYTSTFLRFIIIGNCSSRRCRGGGGGILASLSTRLFCQHGHQIAEERLGRHPAPSPGRPRAFDYFLCPGRGEFDG